MEEEKTIKDQNEINNMKDLKQVIIFVIVIVINYVHALEQCKIYFTYPLNWETVKKGITNSHPQPFDAQTVNNMEHILEHYLYGYSSNLRGFIFGFMHAALMILGYYSGWSINKLLKIISNGYIAGIFGAALSHVIADVIASFLDPHIRSMVLGIVVGGIIPLFFIPLLEKYVVKSSLYISVDGNKTFKKDLKK